MKWTKNKVNMVLQSYEELLQLADEYVTAEFPDLERGDISIDDYEITEYVNTSCNCHPEYEAVSRSSVDMFSEWLEEQNK